jgi:hypothetical protein
MIELMNMKRGDHLTYDYDFIIDRRSPVGNPFKIGNGVNRDGSCIKYDRYFNFRVWRAKQYNANDPEDLKFILYLNEIEEAYKKWGRLRLFCWCAPKRCHGETIKRYIEGAK